ncbi:uncharacterized protein LOC128955772 [Oppia nitens]|uniref:uncharacterized protein LOC128955772 n=1 Tax=Oppia nitens TaxID=1686743 RepID=UPI0023D98D69|nr:uncharacterized protein LOC128955772 [Oppia nitens]
MTGLTVSQALTYSSKLKNPIQYNDQKVDHKKIVSDIMQELLISDIKDNKIDNCSGGQIKRLSIGLELTSVCKPYLLFIDEPTTGLDTHSAIMVISCLKQLSRNHNMSIIISIHQPNNELYQMFDTIYVLAKGGQTLYSGFPQNLDQFIADNHIKCNENQLAIDMLMKHSYNSTNISNVNNHLKTNIIKNIDSNLILMKSQSVYQTKSWFNLYDIFINIKRNIHSVYISQWMITWTLYLFYFVLNIIFVTCFSSDMSTIDGCIDFSNYLDAKTYTDMTYEAYVLFQTQSYLFISSLKLCLIVCLFTIYTICHNSKIISSEYKNGNYIMKMLIF